jgi:hypothetical protein
MAESSPERWRAAATTWSEYRPGRVRAAVQRDSGTARPARHFRAAGALGQAAIGRTSHRASDGRLPPQPRACARPRHRIDHCCGTGATGQRLPSVTPQRRLSSLIEGEAARGAVERCLCLMVRSAGLVGGFRPGTGLLEASSMVVRADSGRLRRSGKWPDLIGGTVCAPELPGCLPGSYGLPPLGLSVSRNVTPPIFHASGICSSGRPVTPGHTASGAGDCHIVRPSAKGEAPCPVQRP